MMDDGMVAVTEDPVPIQEQWMVSDKKANGEDEKKSSATSNEEEREEEEEEEKEIPEEEARELFENMATTMSEPDQQSIRDQCFMIYSKMPRNKDHTGVLEMEDVSMIVEQWKPIEEILCLYVRIARKLPANFHLDSMSTLLCMAKQCGYTPSTFLTKTKTLVVKATQSPTISGYGLNFSFHTIAKSERKGYDIDKKLLGLSLTLTLLEHTVSNSCGLISRNGMRSSAAREPVKKNIDIGESRDVFLETMPSNEFHKKNSLIHRLWLAINHRWMAYRLVENLFDTSKKPLTNEDMLEYSFRMHAACGRTRYDFLDPMAGICFRFFGREAIEANRSPLDDLWKEPSKFLEYGRSCMASFTEESKILNLVATFRSLKPVYPTRCASYGRGIDKERRWLMLRGYIFWYWLKRESNTEIRSQVLSKIESTSISEESWGTKKNKEKKKRKKSISRRKSTKVVRSRQEQEQDIEERLVPFENSLEEEENGSYCRVMPQAKRVCPTGRLWLSNNTAAFIAQPPEEMKTAEAMITTANDNHVGGSLPHSVTNPAETRKYYLSQDWKSIQLMSQSELDQVTASYLLIHTTNNYGMDICSKLSPLEVYSADKLNDFRHSRLCGPPGYKPRQQEDGPVVLKIGTATDLFIDRSSTKFFHIARNQSSYFREYGNILPPDDMVVDLCKSVVKYGIIDKQRAKCQYRINIGCGGQDYREGKPALLIGRKFERLLEEDKEFDGDGIISCIGLFVKFLWLVSQDIQRDARDSPLAPDRKRWMAYAKHLSKYLKIEDVEVGFEDITVVVSPILSNTDTQNTITKNRDVETVAEHTDVMNDHVGGYSRTCVFNACFSLSSKVSIHMQVIGNFRRVIRQSMVPFTKSLESTIRNAKRYIEAWRTNMRTIFAGVSSNEEWDPFDRSKFFLDDELPFRSISINGERKSKHHRKKINDETQEEQNKITGKDTIRGEYLLTEIGVSRVTSFSMFIDPILKLSNTLYTDQRIELAFFSSFLSNPFWFHYVMTRLAIKEGFSFCDHPMYDVIEELYSTFGAWQGGPHNRWSPCGGAVPVVNLFGAYPGATSTERLAGMDKLKAIVGILFTHMEWVNTLKGKGEDPFLDDIPLSTIKLQWESIRKQIHRIIPCQFSLFRISVFTTIAIGCNELTTGPHLKQLTIPLPGTAAYKHLVDPSKGMMPEDSAGVEDEDGFALRNQDRLMLYLSTSLSRKRYVRDEMECLLCESHPARNLECRDWFCKDQNIYDLLDDGTVMRRSYGKSSTWTEMGTPQQWTFKFLCDHDTEEGTTDESETRNDGINYKVDKSFSPYANALGVELRQTDGSFVYHGRQRRVVTTQVHETVAPMHETVTRTHRNGIRQQRSEHYQNPFLHSTTERQQGWGKCLILHQYRSATLFSSEEVSTNTKNGNKILVLGNGEKAKEYVTECNEMEKLTHGPSFLQKFRETIQVMGAACYHQEVAEKGLEEKITYFPGHLDKRSIDTVCFVPISNKPFFTLVAIPSSSRIEQDAESNRQFHTWLSTLNSEERQSIDDFRCDFTKSAHSFMKRTDLESLVYWNVLGSILQFPSSRYFHATIIPKVLEREGETKTYRDLLIFHSLVMVQ